MGVIWTLLDINFIVYSFLFDLWMGNTIASAAMNAYKGLDLILCWDHQHGTRFVFSKLHFVHQLCVRCDLLQRRVTRNVLMNWSWCSFLRNLDKAVRSLLTSGCKQDGHVCTSLAITSTSSNMSEDHLYENIMGCFLNMQRLSALRDPTLKSHADWFEEHWGVPVLLCKSILLPPSDHINSYRADWLAKGCLLCL